MDDRLGQPINYQYAHRGTTVNWFNMDNEETAQRLGRTEHIEYRFNDWGFRMDLDMHEIPEGCDIYMGDSHVVAQGINLEDSWHWKMHHEYFKSDKPFVSLASSGTTNDTNYRLIHYWVPKLKPARIFLYNAPGYKMEVVTSDHGVVGYGPWLYGEYTLGERKELPDSFEKQVWLQIVAPPFQRQMNDLRNKDALFSLCSRLGVELHYAESPDIIAMEDRGVAKKWYGEARDGFHAGVNQQMIHMEDFIRQTNL